MLEDLYSTYPLKSAIPQKAEFSELEWKARVELAAVYRLVALYGMTDMVYNHISAAVPGEEGHFLINPFGMHYSDIRASSLIKVDIEGNEIFNPWADMKLNQAGYVIHSAIHQNRPEVQCVIHTHTPAGMAVSALECGLLAMTQTSAKFSNIAYHDYQGVVVDEVEKESLLRNLGDSEVMILRNHGLLVTGRSMQEAFNNIYRLERSCHTQILAMSCNSPLRKIDDGVLLKTRAQLRLQPSTLVGEKKPYGFLEWRALIRMLDKADDSYKF